MEKSSKPLRMDTANTSKALLDEDEKLNGISKVNV
jgi:hypothetical protein